MPEASVKLYLSETFFKLSYNLGENLDNFQKSIEKSFGFSFFKLLSYNLSSNSGCTACLCTNELY